MMTCNGRLFRSVTDCQLIVRRDTTAAQSLLRCLLTCDNYELQDKASEGPNEMGADGTSYGTDRFIICVCCLPFCTFRCNHSSLVCAKGSGIIFFACISFCIESLDIRQRGVMSEVGSNDEMFPCSVEPIITRLYTSKIVPRMGITGNCCLF